MNTKVQKKIDNVVFDALREIKVFESERWGGYRRSVSELTNALNHYNWDFDDREEYPYFQTLGYSVGKMLISDYQLYCLKNLSSILYDAKLLYENNLINFVELRSIVVRVKRDVYKRYKAIEKSNAKKNLNDKKLHSDSLLILQAKLAILENEN